MEIVTTYQMHHKFPTRNPSGCESYTH